jgi:hypothetical protein
MKQSTIALWIYDIRILKDANIDIFFNLSNSQIIELGTLSLNIPNYAGTVSVFGMEGRSMVIMSPDSYSITRFTDVSSVFRRFYGDRSSIEVTFRARNVNGIYIPSADWSYGRVVFYRV